MTEHYLRFARPIAAAVRAHGVCRIVAVSSLGRVAADPDQPLRAVATADVARTAAELLDDPTWAAWRVWSFVNRSTTRPASTQGRRVTHPCG